MLEEFMHAIEAQAGKPYVWGADGPASFDCSGLIVYGLQQVGVLRPGEDRHSSALIQMCEPIPVRRAINTRGAVLYRPGHIAISRGDGTTIEARSPEQGVGFFDVLDRGWTRAGILTQLAEQAPKIEESQEEKIMSDGRMASPAAGRVTSGFGRRGRLSSLIPGMFHAGIDIANTAGTPVCAAYAGTVVTAGWNRVPGRTGQHVVIANPDGERQLYGHLSRIDVAVGQTVAIGQQIGAMGATGNVTGPHLHFETWRSADSSDVEDPMRHFNAHGVTPGATPAVARPSAANPTPEHVAEPYYAGLIDGEPGPMTVTALQEFLHDRGHYSGVIDGIFGPLTVIGLQRWLQDQGFYLGYLLDGRLEYWTAAELQRWLQSVGWYVGFVIDGKAEAETIKALQRFLATKRKAGA
ncbi:peptidoglycan DD-metalloendopeptidase family protein [Trueperella pyogenes]|uniref:peptidoglycan DD-metalloendopeptidase family protein n=1 Tax=Trueperella pyogenes TaxID=1661 RepID=UPI0032558FF2